MESKVLGAPAIEKVLAELPKKIGEKVLVKALRAGARPIVRAAKQRVPVRTGKLKKSITVRKATQKQRRKGTGIVLIGFRKPTSAIAHLVEFGTSKASAQPFMRPAIDEKGRDAIQTIGEKLGKEIEAEATKLAGPLAKSGLLKRHRRRRR
jgi:HK97 gp10 family phage protein